MMSTTSKLYARAGAAAIAAVLALSSTPSWAQETPATTQPATTSTPPAPVATDPPPLTTTDTNTTPDTSAADTTVAPATQATRSPARARTKVPARTAHRAATTQATHVSAPPVATRAVASARATPAPAPAVASPAVPPPPAVALNTAPPPAPTAPVKHAAALSNDTAADMGIGALALVVIGGGAWALARRRRRDEELADDTYEPTYESTAAVEPAAEAEPVAPAAAATVAHEQPAIVAPSAFAWGNERAAAGNAADDGSDRRAGESWVERAYRGPSPANPSASLRNRLKRAAFFDKREREVAAGEAEPVETDAGLPEAMTDEQERELA